VRHRVPSRFSWTLTLDRPCSVVVWRVLATHSIFQFPLHFPFRASPCAITFQLDSNTVYTMFRGSVKSTGYPLHIPVPPHFPFRASPCAIKFQLDSNTGYTMFRGSVKSTGYPLHSPVSHLFPSRASPYAITFQLDSSCEQQKLWRYGIKWCDQPRNGQDGQVRTYLTVLLYSCSYIIDVHFLGAREFFFPITAGLLWRLVS